MNKLLAISRFAPAEPDARTMKEWNLAYESGNEKPEYNYEEEMANSRLRSHIRVIKASMRIDKTLHKLYDDVEAGRLLDAPYHEWMQLMQEAYERYKTDEWPLVWAKRVIDVAEAFDSKTES